MNKRISYKINRFQLQMEADVRDSGNETLKTGFLRNMLCGNEIAGWDSPQSEPSQRMCPVLD